MEHVAEMCEFVHSGALETGMGAEGAGRLRLAVEEVASNIVRHGFAPGEEGEVRIDFEKASSRVSVRVSDNGAPFNPLDFPRPDVSAPLDQRPVGGLGIFLTGKMVDDLRYERKEGRNVLVLEKLL